MKRLTIKYYRLGCPLEHYISLMRPMVFLSSMSLVLTLFVLLSGFVNEKL